MRLRRFATLVVCLKAVDAGPAGAGESGATTLLPSPVIRSVNFDLLRLQRAAPGSDLWPITWADDDQLYTSWGDGGGFGGTDSEGRVALGIATLQGSAEHWTGINILGGKNPLCPTPPFRGKSNGILCVGGVLYLHVIHQDNWCCAKIGRSIDRGKTWSFNEGTFDSNRWDFAEPDGAFSDLTFLNFGRNYRGARDGFIYAYSQDHRRRSDGSISDLTDSVALFRVPKDKIQNRRAYEYFSGLDGNRPRWTREILKRRAVFAAAPGVGFAVRVDYNPGIKRYLLTTFHRWDGSWGIYDAPEPWGPWGIAATFERWIDSTPKFGFTFPQKWMSPDGTTMYMIFSGTGPYDSFNVVKATLVLK